MRRTRNWILGLVVAAVLISIGVLVARRLVASEEVIERARTTLPVPVEVARIERGAIENRRTFSGALEATARVTIAPKVAGRIVSLPLDVADHVARGEVVARLDGDEFAQTVMQVQAELAVANAGLVEAENGAEIARRALERTQTLHERGIASDSQLDTVRAEHLAKDAAVEVAKAQVTRAEASLEAARIRLGYSTIRADWEGGDDRRVVAERFAEEGDTVSANTPLLSVIELDPVDAVIFATEREYALLAPGQPVKLVTDAYPERTWEGAVERIAPVFREGSRQARVEVTVPNADEALKPGMFVRVEAVLGREEGATIVPEEAITERDGQDVIFVVGPERMTARMVPVRTGIRDRGRVEVIVEDLVEEHVVTLGQQLLAEESRITIPDENGAREAGSGGAG